jgi:hypothetical protein
MTRQAPSTASDHTIRFSTPLSLANGQTMAIEFAVGFNLTAITSADVTVNYGIITGDENSLAISSLVTGNVLTITNNGALIPTNNKIIVKIGLVADGSNQIVNPSATGSKIIRITLSNGAAGSLAVPISPDSIGICQDAQGGSSGTQTTVDPTLALPTIIFDFPSVECPIFQTPFLTKGTRPSEVSVFINDNGDNFAYLTSTTWQKMLDYALGLNIFSIFGIYPTGQRTTVGSYRIYRAPVGDVNKDFKINDFDLAGMAWHWSSGWCYADFNSDLKVDDFDLAGLSSHWGL